MINLVYHKRPPLHTIALEHSRFCRIKYNRFYNINLKDLEVIFMAYDTRELLARLIQCEAGGEGESGMKAVATVIMNRATITYGEFARINKGGNVRNVIEQAGQFVCMRTSVGGTYNAQNIYNMTPTQENYDIADWALAGGKLSGVDESLFFYNPFSPKCAKYFPTNVGVIHNRIGDHCFYLPTSYYAKT